MDHTQRIVALGHRVQNDAHGIHVVDLIKLLFLHDGLAVNAVNALDPALHVGILHAVFLQALLNGMAHMLQKFIAAVLGQLFLDLVVANGIQIL